MKEIDPVLLQLAIFLPLALCNGLYRDVHFFIQPKSSVPSISKDVIGLADDEKVDVPAQPITKS